MTVSRSAVRILVGLACLSVGGPAYAQAARETVPCESSYDDLFVICETRTITFPSSGPLVIDAGRGGAITLVGGDGEGVRVEASVEAYGRSRAAAVAVAEGLIITGPDSIRASGPGYASVSYRVYVPRRTDASLTTRNGSIRIEGVTGALRFQTRNGEVSLDSVGGSIAGRTQNGPVAVSLVAGAWDGAGLDVETSNGLIQLSLPYDHPSLPVVGIEWSPPRSVAELVGKPLQETGSGNGSAGVYQLDVAVPSRANLALRIGRQTEEVEGVTSDFAFEVPRGQGVTLQADIEWSRRTTGRYPEASTVPRRVVYVGPAGAAGSLRLATRNGEAVVVWTEAP